MTPSQFWKLHPIEFWWLVEAKTPDSQKGERTYADAWQSLLDAEAEQE